MNAVNQAPCFLIFSERAATFALPAAGVYNLLSIPRLTPLDETAPWVIGGFDLHGALTPVVSLSAWLGDPLPLARRGDLVVVTLVRGDPLGLHADAVLGSEPALSSPRPPPGVQVPGHPATAPLARLALPGGSVLLLDPGVLPLAADPSAADPAERRLLRFERGLAEEDIAELEHRAHRYSGLGARLRQAAMAPDYC